MTATDLEIILDVDLDKAIPCVVVGCEREASWRVRLLHPSGDLCEHGFHCDDCRQKKATSIVGKVVFCQTHHIVCCYLEWTPL